jgi:hypothetical protein
MTDPTERVATEDVPPTLSLTYTHQKRPAELVKFVMRVKELEP